MAIPGNGNQKRDLQDRIAVEVGLGLEREGVQRLQHREAGILDTALDAALPASGHLQVHQLRQVVGRRLSLAGGLLSQPPPLRRDRRQGDPDSRTPVGPSFRSRAWAVPARADGRWGARMAMKPAAAATSSSASSRRSSPAASR